MFDDADSADDLMYAYFVHMPNGLHFTDGSHRTVVPFDVDSNGTVRRAYCNSPYYCLIFQGLEKYRMNVGASVTIVDGPPAPEAGEKRKREEGESKQ